MTKRGAARAITAVFSKLLIFLAAVTSAASFLRDTGGSCAGTGLIKERTGYTCAGFTEYSSEASLKDL